MKLIDTQTSYSELQAFLEELNWIKNEQIIHVSIPGEGNMNVVVRVSTNQRSFILKQSRPYVQKYQDIPAPLGRIQTEHTFYKVTEHPELKMHLPEIIAFDPAEHLIMMSDLGQGDDMTILYSERTCSTQSLSLLVKILNRLHQIKPPSHYPENKELRSLNHQHVFVLPFIMDNGFDLDGVQMGLQELSTPYKKDFPLKTVIEELGKLYMSQGATLLHGDYYPGSWMKTSDQLYILDPEFSFVGYKEFDVGVLIAHLIIASSDQAFLQEVVHLYEGELDTQLLKQTAGVEIMRRIIGLAQLPLERNLREKSRLLEIAYSLIMDSTI